MSKQSDEAFAAAQAEIARVKASGGPVLNLNRVGKLGKKVGGLNRIPEEISGLVGITTLYLSRTQVSDLTPLAGMTGITRLDLRGTRVSDLTPLAGMTGITALDLRGTQVSDLTPLAGMTELAANPSLFGLRFEDTPATRDDARLAEIAGIEDNAERARALYAYLDIPAQSSQGLRYGIGSGGQVGYDRPSHSQVLPPRAIQIHALLVEDLPELILSFGGGHNQPYAKVARHLDRYWSGIGGDLPQLQPALIWKAGNDLRVYLRQDVARRPADMNNTPQLDADLRMGLEGFVATHNVLSALHPDLAALDAASIDPADRQRAEMDRALLQAAIDAFAVQTRLILAEIVDDLRDLHTEALGAGKTAERALAIEQESLENLIKFVVAQAVVEVQRKEGIGEKIAGDVRAAAVGTVAVGLATNFPQLVGAIQPEMGALISALHGAEYSLLQAIDYIKLRLSRRKA